MNILEKSSNRKKVSILNLVKSGYYPVAYGLELTENYHDNGKLNDNDYEELAEYLENLLQKEISDNTIEKIIENAVQEEMNNNETLEDNSDIEEIQEEISENSDEDVSENANINEDDTEINESTAKMEETSINE